MSKPPAFQFYPKDWLSDLAVRSMTAEQRGHYIDLLATAWLEGGIPADEDKLRRLMGLSQRRFEGVWDALSDRWEGDGNGRLINPRQERQRVELEAFIEKQRAAGIASGRARRKGNGG